MNQSARDNYLVTEVMTATPQKLQLMLIEAALRMAERGRSKWREGDDLQAAESLSRAQQIVGELLASLDRDSDLPMVRRVAAIYLYLFRTLMEASHAHDEVKLADAVRVLEEERETWRQVCEKLGANVPGGGAKFTASPSPKPLVDLHVDADLLHCDVPGGFSLDA